MVYLDFWLGIKVNRLLIAVDFNYTPLRVKPDIF